MMNFKEFYFTEAKKDASLKDENNPVLKSLFDKLDQYVTENVRKDFTDEEKKLFLTIQPAKVGVQVYRSRMYHTSPGKVGEIVDYPVRQFYNGWSLNKLMSKKLSGEGLGMGSTKVRKKEKKNFSVTYQTKTNKRTFFLGEFLEKFKNSKFSKRYTSLFAMVRKEKEVLMFDDVKAKIVRNDSLKEI